MVKSCTRRNRELAKFTQSEKTMKIVKKIEKLYNDLKAGRISEKEFKKEASHEDTLLYASYHKAYLRYRNCYLERDAREFSEGNVTKSLFRKNFYEIPRNTAKSKSRYSRFSRTMSPFGEHDRGRFYSEGNELGRISENAENIQRHLQDGDINNDSQRLAEKTAAGSGGYDEIRTSPGDVRNSSELTRRNEREVSELDTRRTGRAGENVEQAIEEVLTDDLDNRRTGETAGSRTNRTVQTRPVSDMRDVPSGTSSTREISPEVQQIYDYYKKLSPETEKLKIKRGAITKEQAENRLKQQGDGSGKGLYYKDYSEPTSDAEFIEWTKDYNEARNSKEGEFGVKQKDGTKKANLKGTIEDAIREKHTKFALDLVEEQFAKPIENGKIQQGYVGINKAILGTAIRRKYGTSWYETMLKGGDAIDKAFNEKQAKGWKEFVENNNQLDYQIPKQVFDKLFDGSGETVAEYWSRYSKTHTHKAIAKTAGALLDAYNNSFKRGVLASASFFVNNRMGNQIMLAAKSNPVEHV